MHTQANVSSSIQHPSSSSELRQLLKTKRFQYLLFILLGIFIFTLPAIYLSESWSDYMRMNVTFEQSPDQALSESELSLLLWFMFYLFFCMAGIVVVILIYNIATAIKMRSGVVVFPTGVVKKSAV
jgi:flagellar biosynthesis protein FlhB